MKTKARKEDWILIGLVSFIYLVQKLISSNLGIYMEECRDANAYIMAMNGVLPYNNFSSWVYGPFAFLVYPTIFKIFGVSLLVLRLAYIAVSALVIPLVYYLARRLMPPAWSALSAFLSTILIDVPYYTYNHILATVAGLLALICCARFIERHQTYNLFLTGFFIGIGILVKPIFMGFGILFAFYLFMIFLKFKKAVTWSNIVLLSCGVLISLMVFLFYFTTQCDLKKLLMIMIPLKGGQSIASLSPYSDFSLPSLSSYWLSFASILPYKIFFAPSKWRAVLVESYDKLILFSSIIFPIAIIVFNKLIFRKYRLVKKEDWVWFILFVLFTIFISGQSVFYLSQMGRSFTSQTLFLIITYFLFLINRRELYGRRSLFFRYTIGMLTLCFIFYMVFLHFFRYPFSRYKRYIAPLELATARKIKVTPEEKRLFESLAGYLSKSLKTDDVIGVIGYYPHISFLCRRYNIFSEIEGIFIQVSSLLINGSSSIASQNKADQLQDYLIGILKSQRPKIIVAPIIPGRNYMAARLKGYIEEGYVLKKVIGPADIDIYTPGIVKVYELKG